MEVKTVGVAGCGTMGSGIVITCAQSGYRVIVSEINDQLLSKGLASINSFLTKSVEKGKMSAQDKKTVYGRIKGTTSTADFGTCDLVIEAAIENMDLKKRIFADLDKVSPKHAILATNTSCLSIIDAAVVTARPDKVLGLHFFNPAPIMKLVEIVRTIVTSDDTFETARKFVESLNKTVVTAKDTPGFIVNRLMVPQLLNAVRILETGTATREDIDKAVSLGLNHPMGPLGLSDLVGIDVVCLIAKAMYDDTKDPQFIIPTLMNKMVAAGWLGRKTGKGFYDYS
ncbi:MAG: 3-hydroxybutyryl-CoA dehydrogenase [Chloroflexi bacterium]|nr:3-hydroxybutyryl-CoA dehydrogenase [Chloroflexota bacterium]